MDFRFIFHFRLPNSAPLKAEKIKVRDAKKKLSHSLSVFTCFKTSRLKTDNKFLSLFFSDVGLCAIFDEVHGGHFESNFAISV